MADSRLIWIDLEMTGLNIDPRQLEVARKEVLPENGNTIDFIEADAVSLPFPDDTFDVVLAVECIFHFFSFPWSTSPQIF